MNASHPEPGALAEEAARLVEAAADWARRVVSVVDPDGDRIATGAPECAVCPVCRAIGAIRHEHPEVAERVTVVVTEVATALAGLLRTAFDGPEHGAPGGGTAHATGSGVEHIDLS